MKIFKTIIKIIFWIVILGLVGWGLFFAFKQFVAFISSLKPEVTVAIISAMATILAGIAAVVLSQRYSKQRDIDESHRPKKVEIYRKFLELVTRVLGSHNENVNMEAIPEKELTTQLLGFKTELLLWGSPEIIKYYLQFESISKSQGDIFKAIDNLYKAIRSDIGLSNRELENFELVKMYLKDPEELDKYYTKNKTR